jgi:hypothetical protein
MHTFFSPTRHFRVKEIARAAWMYLIWDNNAAWKHITRYKEKKSGTPNIMKEGNGKGARTTKITNIRLHNG